jgi:hypothetical protein
MQWRDATRPCEGLVCRTGEEKGAAKDVNVLFKVRVGGMMVRERLNALFLQAERQQLGQEPE